MRGALGAVGLAKRRTSAAGPPLDKCDSALALELGPWGFLPGIDISDDGVLRAVRGDGSQACAFWVEKDNQWESFLTLEKLLASGVDLVTANGGVSALSIAPGSNTDVVFAWSGAVWRSSDGLKTFTQILSGILMNANDDFRSWSNRLARDPNNSEVFAFGSQLQGMKITRDGGQNWTHLPSATLPFGIQIDMAPGQPTGDVSRVTETNFTFDDGHVGPAASGGVACIVYDPTSPVIMVNNVRCTSGMYAAVHGNGIFSSTDAGQTWTLISPSNLTTVKTMRRLSNGVLMMAACPSPLTIASTSIRRWQPGTSQWATVPMPITQAFRPIAEDPLTPGRVVTMASGSGQKLCISNDYGQTFTLPANRNTDATGDALGLGAVYGTNGFMSAGELKFDPVVRGRVWLSEGCGCWYYDMPDGPATVNQVVLWHAQSRGITQLVANCAVITGGRAITGNWDRSTLRSSGRGGPIDAIPMPDLVFGSTWDLAVSPFDPNYVVAATANHQSVNTRTESDARSGFSTNGGTSFTAWPTFPTELSDIGHPFAFGAVAVSTPGNVVRVPAYRGRPYYTVDGGQHWLQVVLPGDWQTARPAPTDTNPNRTQNDYGAINFRGHADLHHMLCADQVLPDTFYLYVPGPAGDDHTGVYASTDKGVTWTLIRGSSLPPDAANWVYSSQMSAAPGNAGHLWATQGRFTTEGPLVGGVAAGRDFIRSTDGGATWATVPGLKTVSCFAFGKAAPGATYPTIFAVGYLNHVFGIYVTFDQGVTWRFLTTYPGKKIQDIRHIAADMDTFGVFLTGHTTGHAWGKLSWLNLD